MDKFVDNFEVYIDWGNGNEELIGIAEIDKSLAYEFVEEDNLDVCENTQLLRRKING